MSARWMSKTNGFNGATHPTSKMYVNTMKCVKQMEKMSADSGESINTVAEKILSQSIDELDAYIRSKNEVPVDTNNGKYLQATLLRMEDISAIARAGNISEADALAHIYQAETEAVELNTAERGKILTPSTQAAIMVVYNNLMSGMGDIPGAQTMGGALDLIRQSLQTPKDHVILYDNFNYGDLCNGFDIAGDFGAAPTTNNAGTVKTTDNSGDSSSSIWDLLSTVVKNAGSIANAAGSIGNTVVKTGNGLSGIGSTIGADSISKYVAANWVKILFFILLIAVVIIIIVKSVKNK